MADFDAVLKRINKEMGGAISIVELGKLATPYDTRVPFGIIELDDATKGGWPAGTLNELFGPDGTGKNLVANYNIKRLQEIYGEDARVLYMSFGYKPDRNFMRKCGVKVGYADEELLKVGIDPATATEEQRGHTVGRILFLDLGPDKLAEEKPAESLLTGAIKFIESCTVHLVIIDEMASGETGDDIKKDFKDDPRMATWASLVTRFTKRMYSALRLRDDDGNPNATCILVIQPVRANTDAYSAKFTPFVIPSGHALRHAKAMDLHLSPAGSLVNSKKERVGKKIKWKLSKGKFGTGEGAEGELDFFFFDDAGNGGISQAKSIVEIAMAKGLITRKGPFYYILNYDDKISGGQDAVVDLLRGDEALQAEVYAAIMANNTTGEVAG